MIVGVIGSGSIGPDLAYGFVSALSRVKGAKVYLQDISQEALDKGLARIQGYVKKGVARGKLSPKAAAAIEGMLIPTLEQGDLKDCEYVLEAASEDLGVKKKILAGLETVVSSDCLIGFATSGIPRKQIAAEAKHPERCFVNHPFFPAWRALPIEIVLSGDEALGARMIATIERLGKIPVVTADVECFAADDIFCNYCCEAARIAEDGVATPAQVDAIVNAAIGGGGPFNVMDATGGTQLTVHCQELMESAPTGSAWFKAPKIMLEQGNDPWFDRKNKGDPSHDEETAKKVMDRILGVLLGRTYFVVDNDICAPADLNWLTRMALGFKKGLLDIAADLGADEVHRLVTEYAANNEGFDVPKSVADKKLAEYYSNIRVTRDDGIAVVKVFRPEVMNALNSDTMAELEKAFQELEADGTVQGVVFTSSNGALAGADIGGLASLPDEEACRQMCLTGQAVLAIIEGLSKPVVAAVDGPALGGGAEISMACHARVVGQGLMLGQPEVNLGIIPGYGGTQRLPRLIGFERAMDLLRTGRTVGAKEACEWGWAHGEPASDAIEAAKTLVKRHISGEVKLAPLDPAPMEVPAVPASDIGHRSLAIDAILVDVCREGLARPLAEGLEVEADGFARCKATVDMDIGMKNFMQNGPRTPAVFLHE